jgi:hypothetical protein
MVVVMMLVGIVVGVVSVVSEIPSKSLVPLSKWRILVGGGIMPRFQKGHQWTEEAKAKRVATLKRKWKSGELIHPRVGKKMAPEVIAKMVKTRRLNTLGHRYKAISHGHPYWAIITEDGSRLEHRVIVEKSLGRKLERYEQVHHINGDGLDNRLENLEVLTHAEHRKRHPASVVTRAKISKARELPEGKWAKYYDCCIDCGRSDIKHRGRGLCRLCYDHYRRNNPKNKWAKNYDKCIECGRSDRPHGAYGRCQTCAMRYWKSKKKEGK